MIDGLGERAARTHPRTHGEGGYPTPPVWPDRGVLSWRPPCLAETSSGR